MWRALSMFAVLATSVTAAAAAPSRVKCGDGTLAWGVPGACASHAGVAILLPPPNPLGTPIAQCNNGAVGFGYGRWCLFRGGVAYWMR